MDAMQKMDTLNKIPGISSQDLGGSEHPAENLSSGSI